MKQESFFLRSFYRTRDAGLFFHYVGPSVFGMLICGSYSIVDTIFIGQASGKEGLAAIAVTWPLVMLLWAFGDLAGAGGAVLIAQKNGAGRPDEAQRYFSATCFLLLAGAVVLTCAALPVLPPVLRFLGAEPDMLDTSLRYTRIMTGGLTISLLMSLVMNVIRNDGHPALSMWIMVSGLLGNIALDWVFIFLIGMGAAGAAAASVTSQLFAVLFGVWYFTSSKTRLRFRFREIVRPARDDLKRILLTGLPIYGNMISVIAMLFMHNAQSLQYGQVDGLAAYTVVSGLEALGSMLMTGIAGGVQPLAAGMYGARKFKRQNRFGNYGYQLAFAAGVALMFFSFGMRTVVPGWMGLEGDAARLAARAILLSAPAFLFLGMIRVAGFYYQATGKIAVSSWLIYGDSFLALPLCLYTLPLWLGMDGVWLAMPASRVLLMGLLCYFWFARSKRARNPRP